MTGGGGGQNPKYGKIFFIFILLKRNLIFFRMETVYRLLYSLIAVQWKSYNMIAEHNLLNFFIDREGVRTKQAYYSLIVNLLLGLRDYDLHRIRVLHCSSDVPMFRISHQISLRQG